MKKQTRKITEYILEENDVKTILDSLYYVRHRQDKHPKCGASFINEQEVARLINCLE